MADALKDWLPHVIQQLQVFVSTDIIAGKRWSNEIGARLQETRFGVICVTPENQAAPWLNFEAGACSKHMQDSHVCPYVLEGTPADYSGPMTQFQMVTSDRLGTLQLVVGLNQAASSALSSTRLDRQFDRCWPELERVLTDIRAEQAAQPPQEKRETDDMIRELLELARARNAAPPIAVSQPPTGLTAPPNQQLLEALVTDVLKSAGMDVTNVKVRDAGQLGYTVKVYTPQGVKRLTIPANVVASPANFVQAVKRLIE